MVGIGNVSVGAPEQSSVGKSWADQVESTGVSRPSAISRKGTLRRHFMIFLTLLMI
jgi:hypothetical protein